MPDKVRELTLESWNLHGPTKTEMQPPYAFPAVPALLTIPLLRHRLFVNAELTF